MWFGVEVICVEMFVLISKINRVSSGPTVTSNNEQDSLLVYLQIQRKLTNLLFIAKKTLIYAPIKIFQKPDEGTTERNL